MNHSEIFYSIQGEGMYVGMPSVFFRFSGCPLRCVWCDTPYTSWEAEKKKVSVQQATDSINEYGCEHVVITGGEPYAQTKALEQLCLQLHADHYLTIETAGVIYHPTLADLISLSPKLSNSVPVGQAQAEKHDHFRLNYKVLARFQEQHVCQWKFVIDRSEDIAEVEDIETDLQIPRNHIFLMPQGKTQPEVAGKSQWLAELCKGHGWRFSPRLHVDLWGDTRGV